MDEQLDFIGMEAGVPERCLFLAVMPDRLAAKNILEFADQVSGGRGTPRPVDHLHVSLNGFGHYTEVPARLIRSIDQSCTAVVSETVPFVVSFNRVMQFGGESLVMADTTNDNSPLKAMYQALGRVLLLNGAIRSTTKSFTPHLTMRYGVKGIPTQEMNPFTWMVREVVLILSWQGRTHYDCLGRWELAGA